MSSGEADAIRQPVRQRRVIAITGIPGAGKTTLTEALSEALGIRALSTGGIARMVDPQSRADGAMADEESFRAAFVAALREHSDADVILDGIPRSRGQLDLLPEGAKIIALTCRADIARDRLLRRGREDDQPEVIERRVREQGVLLDVDHADGWLYSVAGWGAVVNTSIKSPGQIAHDVIEYLQGRKKQAF